MLNIPGLVSPLQLNPQASCHPHQYTNLYPSHKPAIPIPKPRPNPPASSTANPCLQHRLACQYPPKSQPLTGPLRGASGAPHPPLFSAASGGHSSSPQSTVKYSFLPVVTLIPGYLHHYYLLPLL